MTGEGIPGGLPGEKQLEDMKTTLDGMTEGLKGLVSSKDKKESLATSLVAKRKEIYKKIVESYKGPKSFKVGYEGVHEAAKQSIISDVSPLVSDDFWKSADLKDVVGGLSRNHDVASMFASDLVAKIAGKLKVRTLDALTERKTFTFDDVSVVDKGDLDVKVTEGGKVPEKVDPKEEEIEAGMKELGEAGLVTTVLGLLGVIDPTKEGAEMDKQLRGIVGGNNYIGRVICGLFGFKFAKKDTEKVIGIISSKSPEMGEKAKDWMGTLSGYRTDLTGDATEESKKVRKKRVLDDLRLSSGDSTLKETVEFEDSQSVRTDEELTLTIPAGGFVQLVNEDKLDLVDLETGQPIEFVSGQKLAGGPNGRRVRLAGGQYLDEGTVFAKGVQVDFDIARGSTGGKRGSYGEYMASKDDGKEKLKEKKDTGETKKDV